MLGYKQIIINSNTLMENDVYDVNKMDQIKKFKKNLPRIVGLLVFCIILFGSLGTVGAGERGILLQFGAVTGKVFNEGLYFKIPLVQEVVKLDVKIQKDEVPATAASKDLQIVTSRVALNYHLEPKNVNKIWQEVGQSYNSRIIAPSIQEAVKATMAKFTAEELITKREDVKDQIKDNLAKRLMQNNIIVDEVNITSFDFSKSFNDAIEQKVTAEQLKLKAVRDLERIEIEADQRVAEAEGKAKAIKTEAQALQFNALLIQLRWIEKWDGKAPTYWGEASPFFGLK